MEIGGFEQIFHKYGLPGIHDEEPGSSVGLATDYGLDGLGIESR
jgi:hypothetical protein